MRLSEIISLLVQHAAASLLESQAEGRLVELGRRLEAAGSLSPEDFEVLVGSLLARSTGEYVDYLEGLLRRFRGEPIFWARDVERRIEAVVSRVVDSPPPVALEFEERPDGLALTQAFVALYGSLCACWPLLRRTAAEV